VLERCMYGILAGNSPSIPELYGHIGYIYTVAAKPICLYIIYATNRDVPYGVFVIYRTMYFTCILPY
jgi:hypothetical protein